jgi:hypothetical protein
MHKLPKKMKHYQDGRRYVSPWQAIAAGAIKTGPVVKVARMKPTTRRSGKENLN